MSREILTLVIDDIPTEYYIDFEKDRKLFTFQSALLNNATPSFRIIERYGELIEIEEIDPRIIQQAKEKIIEILNNPIFDRS